MIRGRDLSELSGVPANFLSKILLELRKIGAVTAVRGTGGGYRLDKPADEIRLADVVGHFDPPRAAFCCLLGGDCEDNWHCSPNNQCEAHPRWHRIRTDFLAFLQETTIAEFASIEIKA